LILVLNVLILLKNIIIIQIVLNILNLLLNLIDKLSLIIRLIRMIEIKAIWTCIVHWLQFIIDILNFMVAIAPWPYFEFILTIINVRSLVDRIKLILNLYSTFLESRPVLLSIFIILFFQYNPITFINFKLFTEVVTYRFILFLIQSWWFSLIYEPIWRILVNS
jgi:hypothetical protein